jgi:hypothetical protein
MTVSLQNGTVAKNFLTRHGLEFQPILKPTFVF